MFVTFFRELKAAGLPITLRFGAGHALAGVLAWLAVIFIFTFSSYQFCEYCREARLNVINCVSKLHRKFIDEFIDAFNNNLPGPPR